MMPARRRRSSSYRELPSSCAADEPSGAGGRICNGEPGGGAWTTASGAAGAAAKLGLMGGAEGTADATGSFDVVPATFNALVESSMTGTATAGGGAVAPASCGDSSGFDAPQPMVPAEYLGCGVGSWAR